MSMQERTGWRDEGLSRLHRTWDIDLPAADLDFILMEYDHCNPVAIIEYKNEHAAPQSKGNPNNKALANLGEMAHLPVFGVRYSDDYMMFWVAALNGRAAIALRGPRASMTQSAYVRFLYELRGKQAPEEIIARIEELYG